MRPCRAAGGSDGGWVLLLWAVGFDFGSGLDVGIVVVVGLVVVRRDVQQPQDGVDAPCQECRGVHGGEEA